jgi:hypothetical protein
MGNKAIFITFSNAKFIFHLFDDEINEATKKKLSKLGLTDISIAWPEKNSDKFLQIPDGLYKQGDFHCEGISVTDTTNDANYSAVHDPITNTIAVLLNGEFFCLNTMDDNVKSLLKQNHGFVSGARFRDTKGKLIKKSKDQWGMTNPLEARIVKNSYKGESQKIEFKITAKDGTFIRGQLV